MKKTPTLLLVLCLISQAFAQVSQPVTPGLKGNGQVFYLETFGWENPADAKGWTAPAGFYMSDPKDIGYNWHWWPNDSLVTSRLTKEPPMQSTTAANGNLCLFLDLYNDGKDPRIDVDNSITFPPIDCSSHSSVIVSYETCFMDYNDYIYWQMLLEVSTDNWVHSAQYDVSFKVKHKGRPNNTSPGIPAIYEANISDVAAGSPNVQFRFTWRNTSLYFWQIDDFKLSEAWDNNLQMKFAEMEWNDGDDNTAMSPIFLIPKSQLAGGGSFTNFKSAVVNFGEYDQEEAYFSVDITKNNTNVFHKEGAKKDIATLIVDTTLITDSYAPVDFGHYKVTYEYKQKQIDNTPIDNKKEVFFNVNDSVYSHADNTAEEAFNWGIEAYGTDGLPMLGHLVGTAYSIFADCEASSISAFIAGGKADGMIDFDFRLFLVPTEGDDLTPIDLLTTLNLVYDSTMIGKWITLGLEKDGESEFLKAGDKVYACLEYNNQHTDIISKRYESIKIGADYSFRLLDPVSVARGDDYSAWTTGGYPGGRNIMVRLNINDHSNINDGVDLTRSSAMVGQNYPNPFNRTTDISYELVNDSDVSITVMDLTGRVVMNVQKGFQLSGKHNIQLDASGLDAGIYLYTMKAGGFTETKRMTVSK
ncbi:MAG: T9SS C-terminal target domain-containing protein [Porphyromonadaceae bacterium]|nr:MAG: T9SS C-terminal target domain-containing protein [Porphyromonadaceae bacterium]